MLRPCIAVGGIIVALSCLADVPSAEALLTEAARAAEYARDPEERALAMAEVAAAWAPISRARYELAAGRAVDFALAARVELSQALTLRGVALRIAPHDRDRASLVLAEAAAISRDLQSPIHRALALREIALTVRGLGLEEGDGLLAEAQAAATEVPEPVLKVACLRDLAAGIAAAEPERATALFVSAGEALGELPAGQQEALLARAELASAWAATDLQAGLKVAEAVEDPSHVTVALATMAEALASVKPELALLLAERLPDGPHRVHLIAAVSAAMPEELSATAAGLAYTALRMLEHAASEWEDDVFAATSAALARESIDEAIATARRIKQADAQGEALAEVARRHAGQDPAKAAAMLEAIDDPTVTEPVLADVLPLLAARDPQRAVELARSMLSRRLRARALSGIAAALSPAPEEG